MHMDVWMCVCCRYAVEASRMADVAQALCDGNPAIGSRIKVLGRPLERIHLKHNTQTPDQQQQQQQQNGVVAANSAAPAPAADDCFVDGKVDVLVSEPIGTFLFNERMIETYLEARDRFLKPGGEHPSH